MRRGGTGLEPKTFVSFLLFVLVLIIFIWISPLNLFIIASFYILLASIISLSLSLFLPKKYCYLVFFFILVFLLLNYFIGFNSINSILLLSFFTALGFMI